jgi:hypothetical protein
MGKELEGFKKSNEEKDDKIKIMRYENDKLVQEVTELKT